VNAYLRDISGEDFTAKDFRTWAGTVYAAKELRALGEHARGLPSLLHPSRDRTRVRGGKTPEPTEAAIVALLGRS